MKMSKLRLMELALRGLEADKMQLEEEISQLKAQMNEISEGETEKPPMAPPAESKRKLKISTKERGRRSERMKLYWIERKRKEAEAEAEAEAKAATAPAE